MKEITDKIYDEKIAELFPLVKSIALKYASNNHPLDDLIQEGMIGVIKAVDNFDETKDTKFSTYAVFWIKKYILSYISKESNLPFTEYNENLHDSGTSSKETSTENNMIAFPPNFPILEKKIIIKLYQHKYTLSEVAKQLEISRERVRQLRELALRRLKSHKINIDLP